MLYTKYTEDTRVTCILETDKTACGQGFLFWHKAFTICVTQTASFKLKFFTKS